jgi:hypothetical protein
MRAAVTDESSCATESGSGPPSATPAARSSPSATTMSAMRTPGWPAPGLEPTAVACWAALRAGLIDIGLLPSDRPRAVVPLCGSGLKECPLRQMPLVGIPPVLYGDAARRYRAMRCPRTRLAACRPVSPAVAAVSCGTVPLTQSAAPGMYGMRVPAYARLQPATRHRWQSWRGLRTMATSALGAGHKVPVAGSRP